MKASARVWLALLVLDAVLLAVIELFYLPLRLPAERGGWQLPLSIVLAAVSTPLLVRGAGRLAPRLGVAAAPLGAWVFTIVVFGAFGPGGDRLLPIDARSLLLLVAGILPSSVLLGRLGRDALVAATAPPGESGRADPA